MFFKAWPVFGYVPGNLKSMEEKGKFEMNRSLNNNNCKRIGYKTITLKD